MRVALAAAIIALLTQPVHSQFKPGVNGTMGGKDIDPRLEQHRKGIEQDYNAAMKRIPDKKTNSDPWADLRGNEPAKKRNSA
jgi:hypothetical protein